VAFTGVESPPTHLPAHARYRELILARGGLGGPGRHRTTDPPGGPPLLMSRPGDRHWDLSHIRCRLPETTTAPPRDRGCSDRTLADFYPRPARLIAPQRSRSPIMADPPGGATCPIAACSMPHGHRRRPGGDSTMWSWCNLQVKGKNSFAAWHRCHPKFGSMRLDNLAGEV
jgi:hypothetical protein